MSIRGIKVDHSTIQTIGV